MKRYDQINYSFVSRGLFSSLIIVLLFVMCNTLSGHRGVSNSMEESIDRELFISEYYLDSSISDLGFLPLQIKNAWLEKQWFYGSNSRYALPMDSAYQIILELEDESNLDGYGAEWCIGLDGDRYFRKCDHKSLITDLDQLPGQQEKWIIQKGVKLDPESKKDTLGVIALQRLDIPSSQNLCPH